jgi:hypothetical protein
MRSIRLLVMACFALLVAYVNPHKANALWCGAIGDACSSNGDCCSGLCIGNQCACQDQGAPCSSGSDCCSGMICNSSHQCEPCGAQGDPCLRASDCCSNQQLICFSDNTCEFCANLGFGCSKDSDCCAFSGMCSGGVCCEPLDAYDEGDPSNCCSGFANGAGFCKNSP